MQEVDRVREQEREHEWGKEAREEGKGASGHEDTVDVGKHTRITSSQF